MSIEDMFKCDEDATSEDLVSVGVCESMEKELDHIRAFVDEMKETSSSNDKLQILTTYKDDEIIKNVLMFTLNPFWKYHVTPKNCIKLDHLCNPTHNNLWVLLTELTNRNISGHDAISSINGIISLYPEHEDLIFSILNKNLKTRASETLVNKVIPNFIPNFKVALAHPFDPKRINLDTEDWYGSRKLDGVRCICIYIHNTQSVKMFSREGNEFLTLDNIKKDILGLGLSEDKVFDGEICIVDENGLEDFQAIMKEIKKKNHTIEDPRYVIFDCLEKPEFDNLTSERLFSERIGNLKIGIFGNNKTLGHLSILEQELIKDDDHISYLIKDAEDKGFEGVMVRKDDTYKGKRSHDILKIKKFFDDEYEVVGIESDTQRVLVNGEEKEEVMLAKAVILHKGSEVGVGSGWSQDQRRLYHSTPELLIGRKITVQYFEETQNSKTKEYSLRFPTVKQIWSFDRDL